MKNATTTVKNTAESHLLFAPERKIIDAESAMKMAERCSDYNDSRSEARNFKCLEFQGVTFKDQDLSGAECQYSIFTDCIFDSVNLSRLSAEFATFQNCQWQNCCLENANFSFATISDSNLYNCCCNGADFPFCHGNFAATSCNMERVTANNADLHLIFSNVNALGFEANCARLELDVTGSSLRRSEFNDGKISGKIENTDLTNSEFQRCSNLAKIVDCATNGMDTEDSYGDDFGDDELEEALNELEEGLLD